jgi:hypothetical protein
MQKTSFLTGCSKRFRYKAPKAPRNEAYTKKHAAVARGEGNPAVGGIDGPFSATC